MHECMDFNFGMLQMYSTKLKQLPKHDAASKTINHSFPVLEHFPLVSALLFILKVSHSFLFRVGFPRIINIGKIIQSHKSLCTTVRKAFVPASMLLLIS